LTACRTPRIGRPLNANEEVSTTASSPSSTTSKPHFRYALPAAFPQPSTAGVQPCRAASPSQAPIASGHADSGPIGSPAARLTPLTTRYATTAARFGAQISDLSARSAK
jgi:hypothetical protein